MADEKLRFIFDVVGDKKAEKAFSDVGKAAGSASDGAASVTQKFSAFASKAAPYAAAVGTIGTAVVGAAMKFKNLALEAGKMSDATGLSIEQASRWIEVAGDLGVEAGTVEQAIGKMSRELDKSPAKFEALGIAVQRTSDGAVDMNATFLSAIDVINGTQDPIARAALASKVFGKGWQEMAELIGQGSAKLADSLGAVSEQKVIDEDERRKAEKFREAMDALNDSLSDLASNLGENVLPMLTALADLTSRVVDLLALLGRTPDNVKQFFRDLAIGRVEGEIDLTPSSPVQPAEPGRVQAPSSYFGQIIGDPNKMAELAAESRRMYLEALEGVSTTSTAAFEGQKALNVLQQEMRDTAAAWKAMVDKINGNIDMNEAVLALGDAFDSAAKAAEAYAKKPTAENLRLMRIEADKAKLAVIDVGQAMNWPPQVVTRFSTLIDDGALETVRRILDRLTDPKVIWFTPKVRTGGKFAMEVDGGNAAGGMTGGTRLVGEYGPEIVHLPSGSFMNTASQTQSIMRSGYAPQESVTVHVHVAGSVVSEGQLVDKVHEGLLRKQRRTPLGLSS